MRIIVLLGIFACSCQGNQGQKKRGDSIMAPAEHPLKQISDNRTDSLLKTLSLPPIISLKTGFHKEYFLERLNNASIKVNDLVAKYRAEYRAEVEKNSSNSMAWTIPKISENVLNKLSPLEYLFYAISNPESYTQNCSIVPMHYFNETETHIVTYLPSILISEMDYSSNRISDIGRNKNLYSPFLDSMLCFSIQDSAFITKAVNFYGRINDKRLIGELIQLVEKGEHHFYATALLSTIVKFDREFIMKQPIGKKLGLTEDGGYMNEKDKIPYTKSNISMLLDCAALYYQKSN